MDNDQIVQAIFTEIDYAKDALEDGDKQTASWLFIRAAKQLVELAKSLHHRYTNANIVDSESGATFE